ncbi:MAG: CpaF family protein [Eubacteriales bacterium]|nr:CpaF family protein [Eubacteriales bacterium]
MKTAEKWEIVHIITDKVRNSINHDRSCTDKEVTKLIEDHIFEYSKESYLSISDKLEIAETTFNSMRRLDVLQPLLENPQITEIMVNGPEKIFIEKGGFVIKEDARFENREKLEDVIQMIVAGSNRTVNESVPIADARLRDGSRVNVVLEPAALNGPILTIRKFSKKPLGLDRMIAMGTLSQEAAELLKILVMAKYNIFVCGGTGCGKTTLLNALTEAIPHDERIITIEDSAELKITGIDNIVRMETRNPNSEGKGIITIRDLIKTSLRMRPERIIVGEVRGPEAIDMLQAMNTGHDGSLSSGHANSVRDMLARLETMVLMAAPIPAEAIRRQIASAIDIVIFMSRMRDKSRKILEISEIEGYRNGEIVINPLYVFAEEECEKGEAVKGDLRKTGSALSNTLKLKMAGLKEVK